MSGSAVAEEVDTRVYTKAELDALRKKLAQRASADGGAQAPEPGDPDPDTPDWSWDVYLIVKFIRDMEKILGFLIDNRIPNPPRALFQKVLKDLGPVVNSATTELESIDSENHRTYKRLQEEGLSAETLAAKLSEHMEGVGGGPILRIYLYSDLLKKQKNWLNIK